MDNLDKARGKLHSLTKTYKSWCEKVANAESAHRRAYDMKKIAKQPGWNKQFPGNHCGETSATCGVQIVLDDTVLIAGDNLEFAKDQVKKLKHSIAAEESTMAVIEETYFGIREETNKKYEDLKAEQAKMDALIDFLSHPDHFGST